MLPPVHLAILWFGAGRLSLLLQGTPPNAAVWIATTGLCLIAVELNRPGSILPGSLGLLLLLLGMASLSHHSCRPWAVGLFAASAILLLLNWWKKLPMLLLVAAASASTLGLRFLLAPGGPEAIHTTVALVCGAGFGIVGAVLSRIAFRARRLKAVN